MLKKCYQSFLNLIWHHILKKIIWVLTQFRTLGNLVLMWDPQKDELRVSCKEFASTATKREMTKQLTSQFDSMGIVSPFILGGKLLLQRMANSGID